MQSILTNSFSKRAAFFVMLPLLVGGVLFSTSHIAHAANTLDCGTDVDSQKQCQAVKDSVYGLLNSAPTNVIIGDSSGVTDKISNQTKSSLRSAHTYGEVAQTSGATPYGITYQAGDTVKCYYDLAFQEFCAVTTPASSNKPVQTIYYNNTFDGAQSVTDSTQGKTPLAGGSTTINSSGGCSISSFTNIGQCIVDVIGPAMLGISSFFLGIAGVLFNLIVVKTVFQFSSLIGNAPGLLIAWGILRDIGNMILLFGFIFMGLMTILDLHSFPTKKALPRLVIFAVLMNFSLFAAEAVIDTSNVFSSVMYSQANNAPCAFGGTLNATHSAGVSSGNTADANTKASEDNLNGCLNVGIAGSIMQASGLSTIFSVNNPGNVSLSVYVGLSLFAVIGAVVMLAASIMLAIRAITLTFLMVLAPLGFAGMAVPPLQQMASRWWSTLMHQAFFAPILLLLIFISLKVSETFSAAGGNAGLAGALSDPNVSTMGIILVFTLIIGFLIASLRAASSFGAMGASFAINTAKAVVTRPLGATSGFFGRRTIGAGAAALQKKYESKLGHSKLVSSNLFGIDSGIAGAFSAARNAKFGSSTSYDANEKHHKARHAEFDKASRKAESSKSVQDAGDKTAMSTALKNISESELAELGVLKEHGPKLDLIAKSLSPEMFEKIMNNKEVSDGVKNEMRGSRFADVAQKAREAETAAVAYKASPSDPVLKAANDTAQKELGAAANQLTAKDFGQIAQSSHADMLDNASFAGALGDDLFKEAKKNTFFTDGQRQQFEARRNERTNDPVFVAARVKGMNRDAVGKISGEALVSTVATGPTGTPKVLDELDGKQLAYVDPGKLTVAQQDTVITHINKLKASGDPRWNSFKNLLIANPKVQEYWSGIITP